MTTSPHSSSEDRLLAAIAAGDHDALARLYDLHAPNLTNELTAAGLPTRHVSAILHDLFVQLWVAAPRLDPATPVTQYIRRLLDAHPKPHLTPRP